MVESVLTVCLTVRGNRSPTYHDLMLAQGLRNAP
jgi:hypothetical protein